MHGNNKQIGANRRHATLSTGPDSQRKVSLPAGPFRTRRAFIAQHAQISLTPSAPCRNPREQSHCPVLEHTQIRPCLDPIRNPSDNGVIDL